MYPHSCSQNSPAYGGVKHCSLRKINILKFDAIACSSPSVLSRSLYMGCFYPLTLNMISLIRPDQTRFWVSEVIRQSNKPSETLEFSLLLSFGQAKESKKKECLSSLVFKKQLTR